MQPHLHMLASFAIVDLAQHARIGEQLYKQAAFDTIPGEVKDNVTEFASGIKPQLQDLLQGGRDSIGQWLQGGSQLAESGVRDMLGLKPNDVNFKSNPLDFLSGNMDSIKGTHDALGAAAPGIGAVGGGLLGAGLGAGAAKLLQGTPEDEEGAKDNRTNMILASLAGGGLGALGGSAASMSPLIQEKLQGLGRMPMVRDGLETARGGLEAGAGMYGDAVTKVKELVTKMMAAKGGAPAAG